MQKTLYQTGIVECSCLLMRILPLSKSALHNIIINALGASENSYFHTAFVLLELFACMNYFLSICLIIVIFAIIYYLKEEMMRGKPGYEHLNEPLHILVEAELPVEIVDARLMQAREILEDLLKPVVSNFILS